MATQPDETAALRDYLSQRDVPCPGCGYNLRGLGGAACPECNQSLRLTVALATGGAGELLAAIAGLAVGGGSAATLLVTIALIVLLRDKSWPRDDEAVLLLWIPGMVLACLATPGVALARRGGRAWFMSRGRQTRRLIAVTCWGASLLGFFLFFSSFLSGM